MHAFSLLNSFLKIFTHLPPPLPPPPPLHARSLSRSLSLINSNFLPKNPKNLKQVINYIAFIVSLIWLDEHYSCTQLGTSRSA